MRTHIKNPHSLPAQLVGHLFHNKDVWVLKGTLTADIQWHHKGGKSNGKRYLPETVGRALRSLEEQCIIAVKEDGISVLYKWLPFKMRVRYIPHSHRTSKSLFIY